MKPLLLLAAAAVVLPAQEPAKKLSYEVASVKRNTSGGGRMAIRGAGPGTGGRFVVENLPLRQLIVMAYGGEGQGPMMQEIQITGAPGWISDERFDIDARPEAGMNPTPEQAREMLQALLEERFHLKVRRETKDGAMYNLVVDKGGPKMKLSSDQTPFRPIPPPGALGTRAGEGAAPPPPPPPGFNPAAGGPMPRGMVMMGIGQFRTGAQPVTALLGPLTREAGRKVVDKTGLTGLYDIELKFTPAQMPNLNGAPPPPELVDPNGPSIFTALQEQLGLKLESATGPIEFLVVERVEKLVEN